MSRRRATDMVREPEGRAKLRSIVEEWGSIHGLRVEIDDAALERFARGLDRRIDRRLRNGEPLATATTASMTEALDEVFEVEIPAKGEAN